jgi:hypothetical protein
MGEDNSSRGGGSDVVDDPSLLLLLFAAGLQRIGGPAAGVGWVRVVGVGCLIGGFAAADEGARQWRWTGLWDGAAKNGLIGRPK